MSMVPMSDPYRHGRSPEWQERVQVPSSWEAVTGGFRTPWRVGRKVGRTLYDADNVLIGVMDTAELAARVVASVNRCTCGNEGRHGRLHDTDCTVYRVWEEKR